MHLQLDITTHILIASKQSVRSAGVGNLLRNFTITQ